MKKQFTFPSKTSTIKTSKLATGRAITDRHGARASKSTSTQKSGRSSDFNPVPQLPADYFLSNDAIQKRLKPKRERRLSFTESDVVITSSVAISRNSSIAVANPGHPGARAGGSTTAPRIEFPSSILSTRSAAIKCYDEDILWPYIDDDEFPQNICWRCKFKGDPIVVGEPTKETHILAALLCVTCLTPCMFLPYWLEWRSTPVERCPNCGAYQTAPPPTQCKTESVGELECGSTEDLYMLTITFLDVQIIVSLKREQKDKLINHLTHNLIAEASVHLKGVIAMRILCSKGAEAMGGFGPRL